MKEFPSWSTDQIHRQIQEGRGYGDGQQPWNRVGGKERGKKKEAKEKPPPRPLKKRHQFLIRKSRVGKPRREILLLIVRKKIGRAQVVESVGCRLSYTKSRANCSITNCDQLTLGAFAPFSVTFLFRCLSFFANLALSLFFFLLFYRYFLCCLSVSRYICDHLSCAPVSG